ncbi:hypothetical protein J4E89_008701 [Alternaria sp. Ai002NY15]|nr:hypothetical protein J4E89_008701 [Alternaria sp. Ai002NY15]
MASTTLSYRLHWQYYDQLIDIHIMQTPTNRTSSPADPSAVSLLITLPPELRNCIYEWLFERDDPVLLHNRDSFHEAGPSLKVYNGWPDPQKADDRRLQVYYSSYEAEVGTDDVFRHDFHQGLALLSSCRQIHDEASGILYGGNTFVFSRVLQLHHADDDSLDTLHEDEDYFQVNYAAQWLNTIGSQFCYLKDVIIDTDTMCGWGRCWGNERIELLPLVRLVWKNADFFNVLSFESTGRLPVCHELNGKMDDGLKLTPIDIATFLNNLFTALARDDVLDIRKYRKSNRLMDYVSIHSFTRFPPIGSMGFRFKEGGEGRDSRSFVVLEQGKKLQWKPKKKHQNPFHTLLDGTRERIAELVLRQTNAITIDLTEHTVHGLDFNLHHAGVLHPHSLGEQLARLNHITLKVTSHQIITDLEDFDKLGDDFSCFDHIPYVLKIMRKCWRTSNPQTILVEIQPRKATILSAIRVDIKGLMTVLRTDQLHSESTLRLTLIPPTSTGAPQQVTIISTAKLQRQVFLLLSDVLLIHDEELSECPGPSTVEAILDDLLSFPNLWIDGYGNLLNACTAEMAVPVAFEYGKLSMKELGVLGYSRATTMDWMHKMFEKADDNITRAHIVHIWDDMRRSLYGDWELRLAPPGLKKFARQE